MKSTFSFFMVAFLSLPVFAGALPDATKIADCTTPADSKNVANSITILFKGADRNDKSGYNIHYTSGNIDRDFPVLGLEWVDSNTLGLRFASYMVLTIHNGSSSNNTIGVALGAPPRNMNCNANFGLIAQ
ncbi:MAG TPA: hypothetical protein VN132_05265 [Bdellovibrio sp.]|nr:hypothetical protein [Bdellovibrio sp.]